jgi:hypothetical protein
MSQIRIDGYAAGLQSMEWASGAPDSSATFGQCSQQRHVGNDRGLWHPDGKPQVIFLIFYDATIDID